ncbi:D-inositol-3-phosphate glycosyltransferase [Promicromonospora thailandica]|uniref:D-inositol-3-phosphate glycosyltransferase n=1 Tax=Promicromonospora thailandica TaxID=765201 RepID=A0A9X2GDA2_9MICO|nr:D-inositol-3-phosphate glycosyltransferase [Promicromonospora thailandica]MCP2266481.1 D-inositol-3-phosphate glycosyltransferase [Promicromonospora thailandica]BFF20169.1 D-inositol-3-phosphate glycosyltransferase [Promicromonospora thailandica]
MRDSLPPDLAAPDETRPLRIAMVSVHTSPLEQPGTGDAGGMNVYVLELSRALARRGAQVEIYTRATSSAQPKVAAVAPGICVVHVPAGPYEGLDKNDLPGQLCAFAAGVLRAEAHRPQGWYDVLHTHYWLSGQVGWLAAERWDVPLVHTMHTMARVKNAALAPGDSPEPQSRVIGEEQVVAEADALVANTDEEAADLVRDYRADPARVHVVQPGVDLGVFCPPDGAADAAALRERLDLPADRKIVLFAGRVQLLKGPDVLVRALGERVWDWRPPLLVVLGGASGRPTAVRELEALAYQEGVGRHLLVRPPVPQGTLADYFRAVDLVAVPSHNESFGLVAAEAQASGTPVVAAAVGGLRTVVQDGVSGVLVPDHEPASWALALKTLLDDDVVRGRLAEGARASAARFGWDRTAEEMLDVYERARKRHAAR